MPIYVSMRNLAIPIGVISSLWSCKCMGIFILPVFFLMFFSFSFRGWKSTPAACSRSRNVLFAWVRLAVITATFSLIEIFLPFFIVASSEVYAGLFAFSALSCVSVVAWLGGAYLDEKFYKSNSSSFALFSAGLSFSAAFFPIVWLCFADSLSGLLHIKLVY